MKKVYNENSDKIHPIMPGRKPFEEASCWDAASQSSILLGKISQTPGGIMMGVIFSFFFLFNKIEKLQLSFANYIFLLNFLLMKLINRYIWCKFVYGISLTVGQKGNYCTFCIQWMTVRQKVPKTHSQS